MAKAIALLIICFPFIILPTELEITAKPAPDKLANAMTFIKSSKLFFCNI